MLIAFIGVVCIGTLLLALPISVRDGAQHTFVEAVFTAVSASCAAGFPLVDLGSTYTGFGLAVILVLMQIGGLVLITISAIFLLLFRRKSPRRAKQLALTVTGGFELSEVKTLTFTIFGITLLIEVIGFFLLSRVFIPEFGIEKGSFTALFYSVSAFCNTGFTLSGNGLGLPELYWPDQPLIVYTLTFLTLAGGIGFVVWMQLFQAIRHRTLALHTKIVLFGTLILTFTGALLFFIFEGLAGNDPAFAALPLPEKIRSAIFLSVTTRSAGFDSQWIPQISVASQWICIFLMFIGAGPGSTAGGVRIPVFFLLARSVYRDITQKPDVTLFRHRIGKTLLRKALVLFTLGFFIVLLLSLLLLFTESAALRDGRLTYVDLLFESVSAYGCVGLSSARTETLTLAGQLLLLPAMLIGRIGPALFAVGTLSSTRQNHREIYPDAHVQIG